jgi:hypothetical protein
MQQLPPNQIKYLQLLEQIATLLPPIFIMGGFAEEALLHKRLTRPHNDVDILVVRSELDQCLEHLKSLGFTKFEVYLEESPGRPFVLGADADNLHVEVVVGNAEPDGCYSFVLDGQNPPDRFHVSIDQGTFQYPATILEDVAIRTISPLALYQMRSACIVTSCFGEPRASDLTSQEQLRKTFFASQDEEQLMPKIVNL